MTVLNKTIFINWTLLKTVNERRAMSFMPVIAYLATLMTAGILGNILLIYIYGTKFKKSTTSYFILWLAFVDIVACALGLPFEITDVWYNSDFPNAMLCKAARFLINLLIMVSVVCLLVVAFDRYFKVCMPHHRPLLKSLKPLVVVSLILSVLVAWPLLFIFGLRSTEVVVTKEYTIKGQSCSLDDSTPPMIIKIYLGTIGCLFIISSLFMVTVYSLLVYRLYQRERAKTESRTAELTAQQQAPMRDRIHSHTDAKSAASRMKIERTTRIFVTITAIFILSFLPNLILLLLRSLKMLSNFDEGSSIVYNILVRSQYVNNVANPFLYGYFNPIFRQQCKILLLGKLTRFQNKDCARGDEGSNAVEDVAAGHLDKNV